jgi:hypothetical protein
MYKCFCNELKRTRYENIIHIAECEPLKNTIAHVDENGDPIYLTTTKLLIKSIWAFCDYPGFRNPTVRAMCYNMYYCLDAICGKYIGSDSEPETELDSELKTGSLCSIRNMCEIVKYNPRKIHKLPATQHMYVEAAKHGIMPPSDMLNVKMIKYLEIYRHIDKHLTRDEFIKMMKKTIPYPVDIIKLIADFTAQNYWILSYNQSVMLPKLHWMDLSKLDFVFWTTTPQGKTHLYSSLNSYIYMPPYMDGGKLPYINFNAKKTPFIKKTLKHRKIIKCGEEVLEKIYNTKNHMECFMGLTFNLGIKEPAYSELKKEFDGALHHFKLLEDRRDILCVFYLACLIL